MITFKTILYFIILYIYSSTSWCLLSRSWAAWPWRWSHIICLSVNTDDMELHEYSCDISCLV